MIVQFKYKNWRGEIAYRKVKPIRIYFGSTEYHKESGWLLQAFDIEKNAERDFSIKDISDWQELE